MEKAEEKEEREDDMKFHKATSLEEITEGWDRTVRHLRQTGKGLALSQRVHFSENIAPVLRRYYELHRTIQERKKVGARFLSDVERPLQYRVRQLSEAMKSLRDGNELS